MHGDDETYSLLIPLTEIFNLVLINIFFAAYEYVPDSEAATTTSVSEKNIFSGPVSEEEETIEIEKDTESDSSEAGSAPYFCNRLEQKIEVVEGTSVRYVFCFSYIDVLMVMIIR